MKKASPNKIEMNTEIYKRRPSLYSAVQLTEKNKIGVIKLFGSSFKGIYFGDKEEELIKLDGVKGKDFLKKGDWAVLDEKGIFTTYTNDEFEKLFEPA